MRSGTWKMQTKGEVVEFYDLSKDIKETTNLADEFPKRASQMRAAIKAWKAGISPK